MIVAAVVGDLHHPELARLLDRDAQPGDRDAGAAVEVLVDHLARVDAVDVVGAEDADHVGLLVVDQVQVLVDRVGRAREPVRAAAHLRRHRRDVVAEERRELPGRRDVAVEAVALVLRQDGDPQEAAVDEVREREVDQPVVAAERNGRLGAVGRERPEPLALAARQNRSRRASPRSTGRRRLPGACQSPVDPLDVVVDHARRRELRRAA